MMQILMASVGLALVSVVVGALGPPPERAHCGAPRASSRVIRLLAGAGACVFVGGLAL